MLFAIFVFLWSIAFFCRTQASSVLPGVWIFNFTGAFQTFAVPLSAVSLLVELRGGSGGVQGYGTTFGGLGGLTTSTLQVTGNETLYIFVGGTGHTQGGWNGGGNGGFWTGGGGGGGSDIRSDMSLNSRLVIAGGGGGAGWYVIGGCGGGLVGCSAVSYH